MQVLCKEDIDKLILEKYEIYSKGNDELAEYIYLPQEYKKMYSGIAYYMGLPIKYWDGSTIIIF